MITNSQDSRTPEPAPARKSWLNFGYRADARPIPPLATRRLIVVALSALMVAAAVLTLTVSTFYALVCVVVAGPLYLWFARSATRNLTTAGDAPLDERQREQLHAAYRTSFLIISGVLLVGGLALANLTVVFDVTGTPPTLEELGWLLFVVGVYLVPWTPVAVLAWRLPDEEAEDALPST